MKLLVLVVLAVGPVLVVYPIPGAADGGAGSPETRPFLELRRCHPGKADFVPESTVSMKRLIGLQVINPLGDRIGEVTDLLVDKRGCIVVFELRIGGFLGIGGEYIRIPSDKARIQSSDRSDELLVLIRATQEHILSDYAQEASSQDKAPE